MKLLKPEWVSHDGKKKFPVLKVFFGFRYFSGAAIVEVTVAVFVITLHLRSIDKCRAGIKPC